MQQAQPSTLRIPDCRPRTPKSPPPPPINLDDCKPLLSTTDTNTSTNSGINGSSAFVFTSSRTIRALQLTQEDRAHDLSPPSSPSSPPSPTDSAQRTLKVLSTPAAFSAQI
ncbi:hypothetical protein A0H81_08255 [Grifola frondosa]|uniref:Uncharacterized protein n=1 Tax=Grifola frondosa TaxID=5627 RepID=A0A1C7M5I5_GRIFR|nr:hypothetical protein A0H81_08255 [Grifola frondosa]